MTNQRGFDSPNLKGLVEGREKKRFVESLQDESASDELIGAFMARKLEEADRVDEFAGSIEHLAELLKGTKDAGKRNEIIAEHFNRFFGNQVESK